MVNDKRLIELVRRNEVLYNKSCADSRLPEKKNETWTNIAKELRTTVEQCSKRWRTLRERYSRESKRMKIESDSGETLGDPWPLFAPLSFLKDHVTPRPFRSKQNMFEELLLDTTTPLPGEDPSPIPFFQSECSSAESFDEPSTQTSPVVAKKRKVDSKIDIDEEFREACTSYKAICKERKAEKKNLAVHAFGQMIVATICEMSGRKQAQAIKQITDVVMTLKMEADE